MPALVAGIHVLLFDAAKTWMAGTKPGHDGGRLTANVRRHNLIAALHLHLRFAGEAVFAEVCLPVSSAEPAMTRSVLVSAKRQIIAFVQSARAFAELARQPIVTVTDAGLNGSAIAHRRAGRPCFLIARYLRRRARLLPGSTPLEADMDDDGGGVSLTRAPGAPGLPPACAAWPCWSRS